MKTLIVAAIRCLLMFLVPAVTYGISAQWDLDPVSGDWNTAANWMPMEVPNGPADTATFGLSNTTGVSISADTEVNGIRFTPAASAYTITANPSLTLTLSGTGITNNSGTVQNFMTATDGSGNFGTIAFHNSATAGSNTIFTNNAATVSSASGGVTEFFDSSTAGNATINNKGGGSAVLDSGGSTTFNDTATVFFATINNDGAQINGGQGGFTDFKNMSTAGGSTINNNGGAANGAGGGFTVFKNVSSAGSATINNKPGTAPGGNGGFTRFENSSSADSATINNNGALALGAAGGFTQFLNGSTAGSATIVATPGRPLAGGSGKIFFYDHSSGGTARVEVFGNFFTDGSLDISVHDDPGVAIGSIEGSGNVFLGSNNLTVGRSGRSTTFSGVIQDGGQGGGGRGSLTKIGPGTLILSGANTYTGKTTIDGGVLQVDGSITSNTSVNPGGKLAGKGTVNGKLINNGKVQPGDAPGTLTVNGDYTQAQFGALMIQIAGTSAGDFSVLNVLGSANLSGILDPLLLNGFVPSVGDQFTFLNYASFSGAFRLNNGGIFNNGTERWVVSYQPTFAVLTATQNVPDHGSTFLLLMLGLLSLVTCQRQLLRKQS